MKAKSFRQQDMENMKGKKAYRVRLVQAKDGQKQIEEAFTINFHIKTINDYKPI